MGAVMIPAQLLPIRIPDRAKTFLVRPVEWLNAVPALCPDGGMILADHIDSAAGRSIWWSPPAGPLHGCTGVEAVRSRGPHGDSLAGVP